MSTTTLEKLNDDAAIKEFEKKKLMILELKTKGLETLGEALLYVEGQIKGIRKRRADNAGRQTPVRRLKEIKKKRTLRMNFSKEL